MKKEDRFYVDTCPGVYYFKNNINNKYYIGQAVNIRKRLIHHISNFENSRYDAPLYRAFNKYGLENFEFGILQRIEEDEVFLKSMLDFWERYYIVLYNSYAPNGYNQTLGGDAGVLGLKMTENQRKIISQNSKKIANDGRNTVYCYDIKNKITIKYSSLVALGEYLGLKLTTESLRNLLIAGQYLMARTKASLCNKIDKYNKRTSLSIATGRDMLGRFPKKVSEEAIQDIINGMRQKDWIIKYNLCKGSYDKTKQKLVKNGKMNFTRVYTKKVPKDIFLKYMENHTVKEAAKYFEVNISRIYKYKKAYLELN